MRNAILIGAALLALVIPAFGGSYYPLRLEDAEAVYLTPSHFPVHANGRADDSAVVQQAISTLADVDFAAYARDRLEHCAALAATREFAAWLGESLT